MINTKCPACGNVTETDDKNVGKPMECPECKEQFTVVELPLTPEEKYQKAVNNLGIATALTLVNLILIIAGSEWGFAFSLWLPEMLTTFGIAGIVIAIIVLVIYGVLWFIAKEKFGAFIAAFVLVCFDTLLGGIICVLALAGDPNSFTAGVVISTIFHVWLLIELIKGLIAHKQINN